MKKIGRIKRWIIAFLAGELITLTKKDRTFRQGIKRASGREKITYVFDTLFNFNKELVKDVQEQVDFEQLKARLDQGVARVQQEYASLQEQLKELITTGNAAGEEIVTQLKERFSRLQESAEMIKQEFSSDFSLDKKMAELKKLIEDLAKKTKSS